MPSQFLKFGVVGTIGFLVDGGILTALVETTELGPYWPRVFSFPVALSVTWFLNRIWTFSTNKSERKSSEYARYAIVQFIGVAVNFLVYSLSILIGPPVMETYVVIPLAIASIAGLVVNYLGAKLWVFRMDS